MNGDEAKKLVDAALATLHEHFDCCQILVSWNEQAETRAVYRGTGNWHARIGMAHDFIKKDDAQTMAVEIADQMEPPPTEASLDQGADVPRFRVGEEVRVRSLGHDGKILEVRWATVGPIYQVSGISCWPTEEELEPAPTPPAEWKLPEPPAGKAWHRISGWTKEMLPEGWRPLLRWEKTEHGDEVFVDGHWNDGVDVGFPMGLGHLHTRTRRPLPVESPASQVPVEEKQGPRVDSEKMTDEILRRAFSERDSANRRVEELREECRKLNAQLHLTVKEREDEEVDAKRWEERFNEMLENRNELYTKLTESEKALTSLRALYAWVPLETRRPTEEDGLTTALEGRWILWANEDGPWVGWLDKDEFRGKKATLWQRLSPLPTAPVVEDAQREKFEEFVRLETHLNFNKNTDRTYAVRHVEWMWLSWQAAFLAGQNSTKP